jgi:hypothetical protein
VGVENNEQEKENDLFKGLNYLTQLGEPNGE